MGVFHPTGLSHWAPTSGCNLQAQIGVWMHDPGIKKGSIQVCLRVEPSHVARKACPRAEVSARCWPTTTCITCSICGPTNRDANTAVVMLSSCGFATILWWVFSTKKTLNGSWSKNNGLAWRCAMADDKQS